MKIDKSAQKTKMSKIYNHDIDRFKHNNEYYLTFVKVSKNGTRHST